MTEDRNAVFVWAIMLMLTIGAWVLAIEAADIALVWTVKEVMSLLA